MPVSLFVFDVHGREIDTHRIIGMVWNCDDMMWFVCYIMAYQVGLKEVILRPGQGSRTN